jgi:hypothetical protein
MRAYEFIIEGVTDDIAVAEFKKYTENNKIIDPEVVDKTVDLFKELIKYRVINPKDVPDGNPSDISYWKKKGWPSFYQFVQDKQHEYQIVKMSKPHGKNGNYRVIAELPGWVVILPLDADASCFAGKHTKVCVAKPTGGHFHKYFYQEDTNLLYFISEYGDEIWLVAFNDKGNVIELADQDNEHIDDDFEQEFFKRTKLDLRKYINHVLDSHLNKLTNARNEHANRKQQVLDWLNTNPTKRNLEIERTLYALKDPELLREYLEKIGTMHYALLKELVSSSPIHLKLIYELLPSDAPSLGMMSVKQYWANLMYIPVHARDYSVCLAAVTSNTQAMQLVPKDLPEYDELAKLANKGK